MHKLPGLRASSIKGGGDGTQSRCRPDHEGLFPTAGLRAKSMGTIGQICILELSFCYCEQLAQREARHRERKGEADRQTETQRHREKETGRPVGNER